MSILKVKSLFFYKNHEIKLKRFCINIDKYWEKSFPVCSENPLSQIKVTIF
jgi:hypothetical protein